MCAQFKYRTTLSWNLIEIKTKVVLLFSIILRNLFLKSILCAFHLSSLLLLFPPPFYLLKILWTRFADSEFYLSLKFTSSLVTPLLFFSFFLSNILFPLLLWSHFFHIPLQNLSFFQFLLSSSVCLPRLFLLCFTIPNSGLLLIFFLDKTRLVPWGTTEVSLLVPHHINLCLVSSCLIILKQCSHIVVSAHTYILQLIYSLIHW